jgi:DNA modification methylase
MILFGDNRATMRMMIDNGFKVQMCVTSPPYFGLRDYGHDGQLGLEKSPEEYVRNMVEVFALVRELLAEDGVLWLNIGDSYVGAMSQHRESGSFGATSCVSKKTQGGIPQTGGCERGAALRAGGLKPKDLIGIPWMLAFALRADGWYLRQDVIWHKPNPMPESVKDRCTKAHEYMFLLSKSEKYYFDNEAIMEPAVGGSKGAAASFKRADSKRGIADVCPASPMPTHRPDREDVRYDGETRNRRSVWSVATKPYKGAHFATFPPALIEPCILSGSRVGDVVFDPFVGSGTTAEVAIKHGRGYLGCELNEAYKPLQDERITAASVTL